jgi:alkaline ceramidase
MKYFSSSVNWCEKDYDSSLYIVEYWNSISSLAISLFGLIGLIALNNKLMYSLLILVGLFSFYFHATLSILGQILDELSITIILSISLLQIYKNNKFHLNCIHLFNAFQIMIQICFPYFNRFCLFLYAIPIIYKINEFIKKSKINHFQYINLNIRNKLIFIKALFISSVICWVLDLFCDHVYMSGLLTKYIQFHALWHVLIGLCAVYAIDLLSLL